MLDKTLLTDLFDRLGIPQAGRQLVSKARVEAPVRKVKSYGGNVITLLASRKMGCEIRTESRHIEFPAAVDHEFDPAVLEYYPQPCELKLELVDTATGEIRNITHTPDFLVLRADGITLEEWKSEAKLARLSEKYPYRYVKGSEAGEWFSPQIERQLAELGIRYRIYSEEAIPRRRVENLLHLADYFHPAAEPCPPHTLARLADVLAEHGACYLSELLASPYGFDVDELLKAIADHQVVADLDREPLNDPKRCRLYRDPILRDFMAAEAKGRQVPGQDRFAFDIAVGARFSFEGQELTISLCGEREQVCTREGGEPITLTRDWILSALEKGQITPTFQPQDPALSLARYTETQLQTALRRQAILQSGSAKVVANRTQRRWLQKQKAALVNGANEVLALVSHTKERGNRSARLTEEQVAILDQVIREHWRNHKAINYKACYRFLQVACDEAGIKTPSYPTLIARIKNEATNHEQRIRHGKRMAYQLSEFVDVLYVDTPVHGSCPFQYVHIDHTQLDIELISSRTGKPLGRPWLSFAIDAWSRRIVGIYLTFDPPSYHSVMMITRDIVRRHGRLPEMIVVDNGRDFMSVAFETFLQAMGVHLRFRPAGQPRHGAVMERIFGRAHSEYVHNLSGNTKATKNVRMVTGKHLPVNFAEWTLECMYFGIEYWATDYYDLEGHPALDCSPREAFQKGLRESGARPQRQILFNQDFLIATCPPVDREGVRLVNRQRGVKVNGMLYWHPEFSDPRLSGQRLPVRYDPWDAASVYVRYKDRWLQATCRNLLGLGQLTEIERRTLTEEYTHRSGTQLDDEKSVQRLGEFMQVFTPEGALAMAFERQQENKSLYSTLQLGAISPVPALQRSRLTKETSLASAPAGTWTAPLPSGASSGALLEEDLPDFDTF